MHIERVTWRDAGQVDPDKDNCWAKPDDLADENPIVESVGWVCKETDNNVTLAMDHCDGETHTRSRIPKGMIVSREVIWKAG
jgi:hypothetical protein